MGPWDVRTPASRLELALDSLKKATLQVTEHWDDQTSRQFQKEHLEPMLPKVRRALAAIDRLGAVLDEAHRACSDEGGGGMFNDQ